MLAQAFQPDYAQLMREESLSVLAVEDDMISLAFLQAQIEGLSHHMVPARNGKEALDVLAAGAERIDVVLMDREMPILDGLSAVKRMKDSPALRRIPVIMITGADRTEDMREGLDAGVFYYLTKPVDAEMLRSVLAAAMREAKQSRTLADELGKHKASFELIDTCKFCFRTLSEAERLAAFVANCFPDPTRVVSGLGEILVNAVEHGTLGIGYDRKGELVEAGIWRAEIERMQGLAEHAGKSVTATVAHKPDGVYFVVEDQGAGFDWRRFLQIDPARAGDNHGRGIAQANAQSFDRLTYNEAGNKAVAFVGLTKQLEW